MGIRQFSLAAMVVAFQAGEVAAFEQHDSHEHGHAALSLVLEGKQLVVELRSPAMNLVGFEHVARTEEQAQQVHAMEARLRQAYELFGLSDDAACLLDKTGVEHNLLVAGKHDEHKDHDDHKGHDHDEHRHHDEHKGHDHDEHEHHDEHKGHDHDEHEHHDEHKGHDHDEHEHHDEHKGHDHDEHKHHDEHKGHDDHSGHDHGEGQSHSDVAVEWSFRCMNPTALKAVDVQLFKAFPALKDLDAQWIGPAGQGAAELNAGTYRIQLQAD